MVLERW